MKASIISPNTYTAPAAWSRPYPVPRAAFDTKTGQHMIADAFAQARLADDVGFDYVSVSEHHFAPLMCSPNAAVWAGALSQVITVIDQIHAFHEATGVGVLDLSFGRASQELTLGAIRLFGERVLPAIRDLSSATAA